MAVKHQIIMRAGTIHVFLLFVYCSYHAPYLEVPDQQRCAGLSVWPAQRDTSGRIMHVCPLVSVCFSLCFIHLCVCVPVQRANLIIQHAVRASEGGGRGRISSPKVSLSTAIKFLFFFVAFPAAYLLLILLLKVDVPS